MVIFKESVVTELKKISDRQMDALLRGVSGSYVKVDWAIKNEKGEPLRDIHAGVYIVIESAYSRTVLYVNGDMTLSECEVYEDDFYVEHGEELLDRERD